MTATEGSDHLFDDIDSPPFSLPSTQSNLAKPDDSRCLGRGGFGAVYRESRDGRIVAVKRLKYSPHPTHLRREIEILERLCHPNIVEYIKYEEGDGGQPGNIVTEYCERGDLKKFINNPNQTYSISLVIDWACQIFDALLCLYRKSIFHRDIKPSNMLLGEKYQLKLCDFGLSKAELTNNSCYGVHGTIRYLAPEAFTDHKNQQIYTYASDLYSAGLVLWECIERRDVFHETVDHRMLQSRICSGKPLERANCLAPVADLIEKCAHRMPADRPSAAKARKDARRLKGAPIYRIFDKWRNHTIAVPENKVPLPVIGRWGDVPEEEKAPWYTRKYRCTKCRSDGHPIEEMFLEHSKLENELKRKWKREWRPDVELELSRRYANSLIVCSKGCQKLQGSQDQPITPWISLKEAQVLIYTSVMQKWIYAIVRPLADQLANSFPMEITAITAKEQRLMGAIRAAGNCEEFEMAFNKHLDFCLKYHNSLVDIQRQMYSARLNLEQMLDDGQIGHESEIDAQSEPEMHKISPMSDLDSNELKSSDELRKIVDKIGIGKEETVDDIEKWMKEVIKAKLLPEEFTSEHGFRLEFRDMLDELGSEHEFEKGKTDLHELYCAFIQTIDHRAPLYTSFSSAQSSDISRMMNILHSPIFREVLSRTSCWFALLSNKEYPSEMDVYEWVGVWKDLTLWGNRAMKDGINFSSFVIRIIQKLLNGGTSEGEGNGIHHGPWHFPFIGEKQRAFEEKYNVRILLITYEGREARWFWIFPSDKPDAALSLWYGSSRYFRVAMGSSSKCLKYEQMELGIIPKDEKWKVTSEKINESTYKRTWTPDEEGEETWIWTANYRPTFDDINCFDCLKGPLPDMSYCSEFTEMC